MVKQNCYAPFIQLQNDQLSSFKLGNKSYILDCEDDLIVKDIRRYCDETVGHTYTGQPAQAFTHHYLQQFKVKSYFNPQVRNALLLSLIHISEPTRPY